MVSSRPYPGGFHPAGWTNCRQLKFSSCEAHGRIFPSWLATAVSPPRTTSFSVQLSCTWTVWNRTGLGFESQINLSPDPRSRSTFHSNETLCHKITMMSDSDKNFLSRFLFQFSFLLFHSRSFRCLRGRLIRFGYRETSSNAIRILS